MHVRLTSSISMHHHTIYTWETRNAGGILFLKHTLTLHSDEILVRVSVANVLVNVQYTVQYLFCSTPDHQPE